MTTPPAEQTTPAGEPCPNVPGRGSPGHRQRLQSFLEPIIVAPYHRLRRTVGRNAILNNLPPHLHDLVVKLSDSANDLLAKAAAPAGGGAVSVGPDDVCTILALVHVLPLLYLTLTRTRHVHRVAEVVFTLLQPAAVSYGVMSEPSVGGGGQGGSKSRKARVLPPWIVMALCTVLERLAGVRPTDHTVYLTVKCIVCAALFEPTGGGLAYAHNLLTALGVTKAYAADGGPTSLRGGSLVGSSPAGSEASSNFSFVDVGLVAASSSMADGPEERTVLTIAEMAGMSWSFKTPLDEPYLVFEVVASGGRRTLGKKVRTDIGIALDDADPDLMEEAEDSGNDTLGDRKKKVETSSSSYAWPGQVMSIPIPVPPSSSTVDDDGSASANSVLRLSAYDRRTIGNDVPVGVAQLPLTAELLTKLEGKGEINSLVLREKKASGGDEAETDGREVGMVNFSIRAC